MDVLFIAGFGPIAPDIRETHAFWSQTFGIEFKEVGPDYFHAEGLDGARTFALWPLSQAAEATFGTTQWPDRLATPQAWIEFELASPEAVGEAAEELEGQGHELLVGPKTEPWGQTTARLMSPEGLLVGVSYMPDFHAG